MPEAQLRRLAHDGPWASPQHHICAIALIAADRMQRSPSGIAMIKGFVVLDGQHEVVILGLGVIVAVRIAGALPHIDAVELWRTKEEEIGVEGSEFVDAPRLG
eukprot:701953-Prymnesium_polylepis.1